MRHALPPHEKPVHVRSIRLTDAELAALRLEAEKENRTLGSLLRHILRCYLLRLR